MTPDPATPAELVLDVGPVAHGGHCVARADGQVVFVRHTLPGERVRAVVTGRSARYLRADAVEVITPSPGRVVPPCPASGPGRCGGCDWQHADLATQRELKAAVVAESLRRLGGVEREVRVEEVAGAPEGLGWRTRERFAIDAASERAGLRRHRSHDVEVLEDCPIADTRVLATGVLRRTWPGAGEVAVAVGGVAGTVVSVDGRPVSGSRVTEAAGGRTWRVSGDGFWQVHPGAAEVLSATAIELLDPRPGEQALDLYAGVGLFAGVLAARLGAGGRVDAVEASAIAVGDARRNLHDLPTVRLHEAAVEDWLAAGHVRRADLVVLDPPRAGARRHVVEAVARLAPRAVAYVACDPAAFARDVRTFTDLGYALADLRAFDCFPMTHHVECVGAFVPVGA
ncbi:MAG TPA: TRAM domain-containing protein [Actinomycetes bacterium]|nr:TRAM domain-containing protein [Actinomycetes bacterium]